MKYHGLSDNIDPKTVKEDGHYKALEHKLETEFTKVDLDKLEAQPVSASPVMPAINSNDQAANVNQDNPIAFAVAVSETSSREPKQIQLELQATKKQTLHLPESSKLTLEEVKPNRWTFN